MVALVFNYDAWTEGLIGGLDDVSDPATYGSCSNRLGWSRKEVPNEHRRR